MGHLEIETEGLCGAAALNRRECLQVGGSRLRREKWWGKAGVDILDVRERSNARRVD